MTIRKHYDLGGLNYGGISSEEPKGESAPAEQTERHPESYCHKCGNDNPVWSADNDLFNEVNGSPYGIMCPICFYKMCREKGVDVFFRATRKHAQEQTPEPKTESGEQSIHDLAEEIKQESENQYPKGPGLQKAFRSGALFGLKLSSASRVDEWVSVFQEPDNLLAIDVVDKKGNIFTGGYYRDNGKVCINPVNGTNVVACYDLEENFVQWRNHVSPSPPKDKQ